MLHINTEVQAEVFPENRVCDMPLSSFVQRELVEPKNRVCDMPPFTTPVKCF